MEHFEDDTSKGIVIIPYSPNSNASIAVSPSIRENIVFNQGAPLNLPFEFRIANPYLSIEELKEIVTEVLPGSSPHNFVVMK